MLEKSTNLLSICEPLMSANCSSQLNAKLVISSGASYLTLNVFGTNVSDIVQQHPPTTQSLRSATQFTFTHSNNVITGVSRPGDS